MSKIYTLLFLILVMAMNVSSPKVVYAALGDIQSSLEDELFRLTNEARIANGLSPLILNTTLRDVVARYRSSDMVKRNYFSHYAPPDNHTSEQMIVEARIPALAFGENIEWNNTPLNQTASYAFNELKNSPRHWLNIINPRYTHMAIGAVEGPLRSDRISYYFTQSFIQISSSTCTATCYYSQVDLDGKTRCYSGNCLDRSLTCSFNNNCGYVTNCSSASEVVCPLL